MSLWVIFQWHIRSLWKRVIVKQLHNPAIICFTLKPFFFFTQAVTVYAFDVSYLQLPGLIIQNILRKKRVTVTLDGWHYSNSIYHYQACLKWKFFFFNFFSPKLFCKYKTPNFWSVLQQSPREIIDRLCI